MSAKTATVLVHNSTNCTENDSIRQYLVSELTKIKFTISATQTLDCNSKLTQNIEISIKNSDITLIVGENQFICSSIAKLFDETLINSTHLANIYSHKEPTNNLVPKTSKIYHVTNHSNGINPVCVNYKNIFILPNNLPSIQVIFKQLISSLLSDNSEQNYGKHFVVNCTNNGYQNELLNRNFEKVFVQIYCQVKIDSCELHVSISSANFSDFICCENKFKQIMTGVVDEQIDESFWGGLEQVRNESYVVQALKVITECYNIYNPQDVILCFNGGKDCTALLYLTIYVLKHLHPNHKEKLRCLYIKSQIPFDEVEQFIDQCQQFYNLELISIDNNVKKALEVILKQQPNLKACLMGTRRTDPYAEKLNSFQMTDSDWPQIMRVNPVLDWNYSDIWTFLIKCKIPYCRLYDFGYTSLGSRDNTGPNPALMYQENGVEKYLPAYELKDGAQERNGRQKYNK